MARVVVVGGGLSGLAAAALLEQQNIDYTLIEVKRRVGGSLISQTVENFIFDGPGFVSDSDLLDHPLIEEWGLRDSLRPVENGVTFAHGVQSLIDSLSNRITGPRLMRMALSSIGELEGGSMALCMENGLMLNARAIILALPARYAERIFYGYHTAITDHLLEYRYDNLFRLSFGYREPVELLFPPEATFINQVTLPERGGMIVQVGLPTTRQTSLSDDVARSMGPTWGWPPADALYSHYWAEADPITPSTPDYPAWRTKLMAMIPPRVALIGSDYVPTPITHGVAPLSQCLTQAQAAIRKILNDL